jgi:hypothetical protein
MALKLFGFRIGRDRRNKTQERRSFVPPENQDGAILVESGGMFGTFVDMDGSVRNEAELITRYRDMSIQPEIDTAIRHIVNEAIVVEENQSSMSLVLDKLDYAENVKDQIREEYETIMNLLNFNNEGQDIFRRWYIDGRLHYHILIDPKNPREGIKELRYIDPRKIHKVNTIERAMTSTNVEVITDMQEYYIFNEMGIDYTNAGQGGAIIAPDAIAYAHSGIIDHNSQIILSHLHKAIKPLNQLRMMEDATVIYRMSRAPERRAFYIDVGNLPKTKAEQYLRDIMNQYRNKIVYDAQTGEIRDDKKFLSMMEDFWLPRRDGSRGTEIQTLQGGANLSELADVEYFQMKLYQALNVPVSRLKPDTGFSLGRSAEVTRDEISFGKFVAAMRNKFTMLMDTLLSRQLMLKGIIAYEDWDYIKQKIFYSFLKDTYFSELKEMEIMRERFNFARDLGVQEFVGTYVSNMWIRQNILQQTEDVIKNEDRQIAEEKAKGEGQPGMGDDMSGGDMGDADMGGDADLTGDEGGDLPPDEDDEGDGTEPEEDEEDTVEFTDKERAAITKAARQSGLDPKEVMGTFTDILSGDGDIGELSDEEKENIEKAAKEAGVDVKTVMKTLNDLGGDTEEEDEEPTAESRIRFRTQLEKLWE